MLSNCKLVWWNTRVYKPLTLDDIRDRLTMARLAPDRAAPIHNATAFRRAVQDLAEGMENVTAKSWTPKKKDPAKTVAAQLSRTVENEETGRLAHQFVGLCYLPEDGLAYSPDGLGIGAHHARAKVTYTASDITQTIRAILSHDGMGSYPLRPSGGIYVVPCSESTEALLAQLSQWANHVNIRLCSVEIPNDSAHQDECADAIHATLQMDLDAHQEAIREYQPTTKLGIIDNRAEAIRATMQLIGRLQVFLGNHVQELTARIGTLNQDLTAKRAMAETAREANRPRRQILVGGAA